MAFSTLKRLLFMFIDLFFLLYIRMIMELNTTNNINSLLEPDDDDEEEYFDCEDNEEYFNHENDEDIFPLFDQKILYIPMIMGLNTIDNINSLLEPDDVDDEEEYLNCEDNEFTFMYLDENNTPIPADKAMKNKDIHPIFPLFDQNLLSHEERKQLLPINPQRLKDKVGCSNSDGRDAFVFLKKPVRWHKDRLERKCGKMEKDSSTKWKSFGHECVSRSMGTYNVMWRKQPPKQSKKKNLNMCEVGIEADVFKKGNGGKRKAENGKFSLSRFKNGFTHFKTEKYATMPQLAPEWAHLLNPPMPYNQQLPPQYTGPPGYTGPFQPLQPLQRPYTGQFPLASVTNNNFNNCYSPVINSNLASSSSLIPELPRFITNPHMNDTRNIEQLAQDNATEDNNEEEDEQQSGGDYSSDEEAEYEEEE
ncbi:hypothetical protein Tco_1320796 [Tanacetum coccineum]